MENYLKEIIMIILPGVFIIHKIKEPLKRLIKLFKIFLISAKDHKEENCCWVDYINDLRIYYNDRRYSTPQIRQFRLMINMNDKRLLKNA